MYVFVGVYYAFTERLLVGSKRIDSTPTNGSRVEIRFSIKVVTLRGSYSREKSHVVFIIEYLLEIDLVCRIFIVLLTLEIYVCTYLLHLNQ